MNLAWYRSHRRRRGAGVSEPVGIMGGMTVHDLLPLLPEPGELRRRCRSFAVLDLILTERYQTHLFQPEFAPGVALAQMDNGSGDNYAIVFDPAGVIGFGFDHESEVSPWREDPREHWPGLLDGVPGPLSPYLDEPAFNFDGLLDATVCFWREGGDGAWRCGPVEFEDGVDDGARWMFETLVGEPVSAYAAFARDYFQREIDVSAVEWVVAGEAVTPSIVTALAPERDVAEVLAAVAEQGYPVAEA